MRKVNYVEYPHSYAHQIAKKLKAISFAANVSKKHVNYVKAIVKNALSAPEVRWTDKEQYFFDAAMSQTDAVQLYYYCKNAVNKAKTISVYVDEAGELIN